MSTSIEPGLYCEEEYLVEEHHIASHVGSGEVQVLSTPSMIAFMERTALRCVEPRLPEGYTTVGTMVNIKHLNPAPRGARVRVSAKLISVDGRRLLFEVKAYWNNMLLGEGTHERFIVNREKFIEKVKSMITQK
ncbi:thioesterase family protein [Desulfurococcus mucosus]|uniref:Thioesterase superfamily n=1 Tax=Desulfurococcus mucosus (strain ATCC 35584 / DSM 2162 / JCM 9187 / O7/1) TaxID=765177 RepID=E8R8R3_DESM0|nr:thioesterase family protein [Desulfurococcus mucosus]ADV64889.1 Thioesterase superfamily [Desulfurococcus mucosus DSM 2162]